VGRSCVFCSLPCQCFQRRICLVAEGPPSAALSQPCLAVQGRKAAAASPPTSDAKSLEALHAELRALKRQVETLEAWLKESDAKRLKA
jgi:hypothetical protein